MRLTVLFATLCAALLLAAPASAAPSWLAPGLSGAETPTTQSTGRIALGANGTAVAAWAQASGATTVLQVSRRVPGLGFTSPLTVGGTTGAADVRVGVDGAGNATVVFAQGTQIRALTWSAAAGGPGAPTLLEAGGSPELAVGRGGTAVAAWLENPTSMTPRVRAAVRPGASGGFGAPATASDFGDGPNPITGLHVAVGDGGHATIIWSRDTLVPNLTLVEVNERAPGGSFATMGTSISSPTAPALSTQPAIAVDASGRSTALWVRNAEVHFAERAQGDPLWSTETRVSQLGANASMPAVGAAPSGAVIAAWLSNGTIESAARPAGGGAFAGLRPISGPGMNPSLPQVAVGANGDALISWSLGDGKSIPTVQRKASGAFGPILNAISAANPVQSFSAPSIGIDDQGNGVAAWTRAENRGGTDFWRFQVASFDAAAPSLNSSVPPGAKVGVALAMAAAASDRVSPVSLSWSFGDGGSATGGVAAHAYGAPGAYTVTTTATDAAGNRTSQTHPVLIAAKPPKRIRSKVRVTWGVAGKRIFLLRMQIVKAPKGSKAELRCADKKKGKQCPFNRTSSKKRKKGTITLFKEVKAKNVIGKQRRTFHAGQTLQVRITKKGYIGKVVRYKLQKGKIPSGKDLCLPPGKKKPRKRC